MQLLHVSLGMVATRAIIDHCFHSQDILKNIGRFLRIRCVPQFHFVLNAPHLHQKLLPQKFHLVELDKRVQLGSGFFNTENYSKTEQKEKRRKNTQSPHDLILHRHLSEMAVLYILPSRFFDGETRRANGKPFTLFFVQEGIKRIIVSRSPHTNH
jgi:hypothetical protein